MTDLDRAIDVIIASLRSGGTLYACGNGGSDAHAGHLVAELVVGFAYRHPPLAADHVSLAGPVGSAAFNDLARDRVYAVQVEARLRPDDVVLLITTSGASDDLLGFAAPGVASRGHAVIAMTGPAGMGLPLSRFATRYQEVRSLVVGTAAIQEEHQRWVHEIARRVEEALCPR